jgi:pimeloyl-ACP methyl ester carboxylesterase
MNSEVDRVGGGDHAVLVLHGWLGSGAAWESLRPYLDVARFSYYFMDYRGYGHRKGVSGIHSIEEAAKDVVSLAGKLGLDRFSIVGHSMGGSVMQRVMVEVPRRVRALVGISPVPASGVSMEGDEWRLFLDAAGNPSSRRAIIDITTGGKLTGVWLDAMVRHSLENSTEEAFADYLEAWSTTDFHDRVVGSRTPVLVLVGAHDPAISQDLMEQTYGAWYENSKIVVLPGVGHYAMDESPIALATHIEKFLVRQ